MEEKNDGGNPGVGGPGPARALLLDNEGLDNSIIEESDLHFGLSSSEESEDTDDTENENEFDEEAGLNPLPIVNRAQPAHGHHLQKEPSNRTVSSVSSAGDNANYGHAMEKEISGRSNFSASSSSMDVGDENSNGISLYPTSLAPDGTRRLNKENSNRSFGSTSVKGNNNNNTSSIMSPRSSRRRITTSSRKPSNLSTVQDEEAAIMELYVLIGEENRERMAIKKNDSGFVIYLEIQDAALDGELVNL